MHTLVTLLSYKDVQKNVFHTIAKTPKVTIYDIGFDTDTLITYLHVCYIFSNPIGFDIGTLTT